MTNFFSKPLPGNAYKRYALVHVRFVVFPCSLSSFTLYSWRLLYK